MKEKFCTVLVKLNGIELGSFESVESAYRHVEEVYRNSPELSDGMMSIGLLRSACEEDQGFWIEDIQIFRNGTAKFKSEWTWYADVERWMEEM